MRNFLTLILVFFSIAKVFACKCVINNFAQEYLESEVVALVTIEKTYANKEYERNGMRLRSYNADLKFEKIYKGKEFKTLNVLGTTTYASSGACEKLVEKGERYLIMVQKNDNGEYLVSSCSTMPRINSMSFKEYDYEKIFNTIEKNRSKILSRKFANYDDESEIYDEKTRKLVTDFTKLNTNFKNKVGIYCVTIDAEGKVNKVTPIEKIGEKEKEIQKLIKKNFIVYDGFETRKGEYLILLEL